jgi:hemerythrin-like domain-containing protein
VWGFYRQARGGSSAERGKSSFELPQCKAILDGPARCYHKEVEILPHRRSWTGHASFPSQTLLLESHDSFAKYGLFLQDRIQVLRRGELPERRVARLAGRLENEFTQWQWSMRCHERYEENKLFPFLECRFGCDCAALRGDHGLLHAKADACAEALTALAERLDEDAWAAAAEGLQAYRSELRRHLCDEETLVIPLLLALPAAEFAAYSEGETCALSDSSEDKRADAV